MKVENIERLDLTPGFHYRFVFLDGCNTANADLCIAFGIERKTIPMAAYRANSLWPRAFVGWKSEKVAGLYQTIWNQSHGAFVSQFFSKWATGTSTLKDSIDYGRNHSGQPSGFTDYQIYGSEDLLWNTTN